MTTMHTEAGSHRAVLLLLPTQTACGRQALRTHAAHCGRRQLIAT